MAPEDPQQRWLRLAKARVIKRWKQARRQWARARKVAGGKLGAARRYRVGREEYIRLRGGRGVTVLKRFSTSGRFVDVYVLD